MMIVPILAAMLAVAMADQVSHQSFKQGNAPAVQTTIHKPHYRGHAAVSSQPSAQPSEVVQYHNEEKYASSAHAPVPKYANRQAPYAPKVTPYPVYSPYKPLPYHPPAPYKPAPYKPVTYKPITYKPVTYKPAPYKPAPYKPAPYTPAPYTPAPYKPAPYKPAPYHEPVYDTPPAYAFSYEVADDYSGTSFAANEDRNDYATTGSYRVALPDGRTQIVTYKVDDAYSGYIADVQYEGEAQYPEYQPHPAPYGPPKPTYH